MTRARIEKVNTSGIFSIDGEDFEVENNIWLVGDDSEVVVIDAAHEAQPIIDAIDGRSVVAIVLTHGHNDHINAALPLAQEVDAPVRIHRADRMLWDVVYPSVTPDDDLAEGDTIVVAGAPLTVMHTPGHSPGGVALYAAPGVLDDDGAGVGHVFGGDTLFNGGPGATGRSFSSFDTIIESIRTKLFTLPESTVVHTGHGDDTSISAESPHLDEWIAAHD